MSTTNLFVELIVIGVGAAAWALLLVAGVLGLNPGHLLGLVFQTGALVPATAGIYLLGILVDRLADTIGQILVAGPVIRGRFGKPGRYFAARAACLEAGGYPAQQFEYNRSRQRICRGWLLNCLVLLVLMPFALARFGGDLPAGFRPGGLALLLAGLALACGLAWWRLLDTELNRLLDRAQELETKAGQAPC